MIDVHKVIKFPLSTEKVVRLIDAENKLVFVVDNDANKADIKSAVEQLFKTNVKNINTHITPQGEKRAYVTFSVDGQALDIATTLGLV